MPKIKMASVYCRTEHECRKHEKRLWYMNYYLSYYCLSETRLLPDFTIWVTR